MDFQWSRNGPMFQEPRWISGYSNQHLILLVGEGNFSFSASLGIGFGAATNMVATSLDSKDELLKKYGPTAEWNTINLMHRGALVFHSFDACKMAIQQKHLLGGYQRSHFHYIVFNFPHAGFLGKENDAHMLRKHRELVCNFFANAKEMLLPGGQVHVRHKLGHPYDEWKLEELAHSTGLKLVGQVPFCLDQFPGYQNCRGDGFRADESFRLGPADTYIFVARDEEPPPKMSQIEPRSRKKKEKQKQVEKEKQVEKQRQVEKQKQVEKQRQVEKQKQVEKEKQVEKQKQVEKEKQVEKQKQVERQRQLKNERLIEHWKKQKQVERQRQLKKERLIEHWKKQKQDFGLNDQMLAQLKCLKKKIIRRGHGSSETPLHQVAADEVVRLEALKKNKKQQLDNSQLRFLRMLKSALQNYNSRV